MKKTVINVILCAAFSLLAAVIIWTFMASVTLDNARKYEADYYWKVADEKFVLAARFDSLSAENNATIGRLYAARASIVKNKIPALLKAEEKYNRAYRLNRYNVVNLIELATLEKELFLAEPTLYKDRLSNAIRYFNEAFERDPNNYRISYEIGRNYIEFWKYIGDEDKKFALQRLRSYLEIEPWHSEKIYYMLWHKFSDFDMLIIITPKNPSAYEALYSFIEKNNLWKYRKKVIGKISKPKRRTATGPAWSGEADDGVSIYENGNMYWAGTASRAIEVPEGKVLIKIKARGEEARGVWPYMIVELDGQEIGEMFVNTAQWKECNFKVDTDGGIKVLSVTFPNDGGDRKKGTDRNLYVGEVEVQKYE